MIHILVGNDTKNKSSEIKDLAKDSEVVVLNESTFSKELLGNYARSRSLFGQSFVVVSDNVLRGEEINFSKDELINLKDSETLFVFLEDKLTLAEENKFKKFASVQRFEEKVAKATPKVNSFALADSFGNRDKKNAWILYNQNINSGVEPEAISGMLFWKIKTMILNGSRLFTTSELKNQSKNIVSLYHRAHRGECDFVVGLEQFILLSLSK